MSSASAMRAPQRPCAAITEFECTKSLIGERKMLAVGEKFPSFSVTATVGTEKDPAKAFKTITDMDYSGKWKVYFFWPKDFTFVCPTEIAAFGKLNKQFADRDTQILGGSTDTEWVHHAWRNNHPDL